MARKRKKGVNGTRKDRVGRREGDGGEEKGEVGLSRCGEGNQV